MKEYPGRLGSQDLVKKLQKTKFFGNPSAASFPCLPKLASLAVFINLAWQKHNV